MINELSSKIWSHDNFHKDYSRLLETNLRVSLNISNGGNKDITNFSYMRKLFQAATVFSASDDPKYKQAAYRIATALWKFTNETESPYKDIISLILSRLGNFPTGDYLFDSFGHWIDTNLKGTLWFEATSHRLDNAFYSNGNIQFVFTDFQARMWKILYEGKSIAVTAPTSAGKSFALQLFLAYNLLKAESFISIYLVPTRALINQVTSALYRLVETSKKEIIITSVPATPEELNMRSGVYVITQERLQVLLDASDNLPVNLIVIDESQMLAEGARGVILHSVLERIKEKNPNVQFLFGSPQTKNPDLYEKIFNLGSVVTLSEIESPIAQNLIFVNTDTIKRKTLSLSAFVDGVRRDLGQIKISTELYGDKLQRLAYLSWFFGKYNKNLVYYGGQAACEDIAIKLVSLFKDENTVDIDTETKNLSDLIKEQIHPKFLLAKTIESGVAFHYGNIPPLIRKTIEDYFVKGKLSYLVCTSTLLQGVNLPAKNLFMLDPTKGVEWNTREDIPISSVDFWNLAGRAGRLGKDYEGNVFLIDYDRWQSDPLRGEKEQIVVPTFYSHIATKSEELINFISSADHPSGAKEDLENTFVKLFNDFRKGRLEEVLQRSPIKISKAVIKELFNVLQAVEERIIIPSNISERHPNISVYRQQVMFDYLCKRIREDGPDHFIPMHPLSEWKDVYQNYLRLFKRIHTHFQGWPRNDKRHVYFAPLAIRWMRGDALARLIDDAYQYKRKISQREPSIATVIRNVLSSIEQDLRFRYVKYTSCYNDILALSLRDCGSEDLIMSIPRIPLFLELGASSNTMVSMIGMGLSRTTAVVLSGIVVDKNMDRKRVVEWLKRNDLEVLNISPICLGEINEMLGKHSE